MRLRESFPISLSCCYPVLGHLWPFWFPSSVSGFWVVAFEQFLDPLDGALQLVDQIFIANRQQLGEDSANLRPDLSIFLATSLHFKQIFPIYQYPMPTLAPMNKARKPCSSQWGALRRFVTRISTSKLTNQAHAPQSVAAARTLCFFATSLALLSQRGFTVQKQSNPHRSVEKLWIQQISVQKSIKLMHRDTGVLMQSTEQASARRVFLATTQQSTLTEAMG